MAKKSSEREPTFTDLYHAIFRGDKPDYDIVARLQPELRGEVHDRKAIELAEFDETGKIKSLAEITIPDTPLWKKMQIGGLKRNPRKQWLGTIKGKGYEALKVYCYYRKPLKEIPCLSHKAIRGLIVVEGGVHPVTLSLDVSELNKLYNILQKLKYRLKKREFLRNSPNSITMVIDTNGR